MRLLAISLLACSAIVAAACAGKDSPNRPTPPSDASQLPIILNQDQLITAKADGSGFTEAPVPPGGTTGSDIAPGGARRVVVRADGQVVIEPLDGGDAAVIPGVQAEGTFINALWSPDGSRLLFGFPQEATARLYAVDADGSNLVDLGAGLDGMPFPLAWSADGARVAFGVYTGDNADAANLLYVARAGGRERVSLGAFTNPQGDGGWDRPAFSPDGTKIAAFAPLAALQLRLFDVAGGPPIDLPGSGINKFSWSPDSQEIAVELSDPQQRTGAIVIADAAIGETQELTSGSWPRWSPSGDRIAYKRLGDGADFQVRTILAEGTGDVAVGPPGYYPWTDLSWSDDGSSLTFVRPAFGPAQLFRLSLRDGTAEAVGATMGVLGDPPQTVVIAPDGRQAAFLTGTSSPGATWHLQDLASGALTTLGGSGFPFSDIQWTPDGPRMATGGASVSIIGPDGTVRSLGPGPAHSVFFSPDGSRLAVLGEHQLSVIDVSGPERTVLYTGEPQVDIVQRVDWAPDGRRLSYTVTHSDNTSGITMSEAFISDLDGNAFNIGAVDAGLPHWSPDGTQLVQARVRNNATAYNSEIWLLDADGRDVRLLASLDGYCCDELRWAPDGSRLAVHDASGTILLIDIATGDTTPAVVSGGGCTLRLADWPEDDTLYVYPACYFGI
ncbi:MAG: hypothetical protein WEC75_10500 [Dehalococcoidia bacterium]